MTALDAIELFMEVWTAETGYMEKASNAQLDDPTANAGRANFTKYARDLDAVGYYNGRKQGTSWCCVGPDWARYEAFGMELAQKSMGQPAKGCGAGVLWVYKYFKAMRRFYQGITPQRGDQAIFVTYNAQGYVSSWQHTGVVTRVKDGRVYIQEGNTSPGKSVIPNGGMVCEKSYPLGDKRIYGYGRPRWDFVAKEMEAADMESRKKCIASIKLKNIEKMSIVMGNGRTLEEVKRTTGCDCIINGGVYDAKLGPVCHLKVDGAVKAKAEWSDFGYGWTSGADIKPLLIPGEAAAVKHDITCVWLLGRGMTTKDKPRYAADMGGTRGRTAMAMTADSLILYCTKDGSSYAATPEALQQEFARMGVSSALMLDGGGSSQCDFGGDQQVTSSRKVNNYICVWTKPEPEKPIAWYEVKYSGGKLNIRKGAGASTTLLGAYTNGTVVAAYEVKNGWARTDRGWCSLQGLVKTADPNAPDDWAKAAWDKAAAKGVMDGTRPRDAITRQEAAVLLDRLGLL